MGTWGAEIFQSDCALDVRDAFEEAMAEGLTALAAADRVWEEEMVEAVEDSDDGPVVRLLDLTEEWTRILV